MSETDCWLTSENGLDQVCLKAGKCEVLLTNIGASVVSLKVPDRNRLSENIVIGYSDVTDYLKNPFYLGSTIGRVAGRISAGKFEIGKHNVLLSRNDRSKNHLHGGFKGISHQLFKTADVYTTSKMAGAEFYYCSAHGQEGYPGNLAVRVKYRLEKSSLLMSYEAITDRATPVNLTNHCYFNLSARTGKTLDQELYIASDYILETCKEYYIPTGKLVGIKNTPYDFSKPKKILTDKNNLPNSGYNDYFILNQSETPAAILFDQYSGRKLEITTSYPGILFYSGDYLGDPFMPCQGICLEAQHYPDAVNHANFPCVLLQPNQLYREYICYTFSA